MKPPRPLPVPVVSCVGSVFHHTRTLQEAETFPDEFVVAAATGGHRPDVFLLFFNELCSCNVGESVCEVVNQ